MAGVPFGRNNLGDEAILQCVIGMIREVAPNWEITVSTGKQVQTAAQLGVSTIPLIGFKPGITDENLAAEAINNHDAFLWAGATGLSDYPEIPLRLLELAEAAGKPAVVFCVGMNSELNPHLYHIRPGSKRRLADTLKRATLGTVDLVASAEEKKQSRTKERIRQGLNRARLVVVRDEESREELLRTGVSLPIQVGVDPAIGIAPASRDQWPSELLPPLEQFRTRVGLCFSSQRPMKDQAEVLAFLNHLLGHRNLALFGIPMNTVTDRPFLEWLRQGVDHPRRFFLAPEDTNAFQALALSAQMNLVVSSRLHLLIFAAFSKVPVIGIQRGSKISNFLSLYELPTAGSTDALDLQCLYHQASTLLQHPESFVRKAAVVRKDLMRRLAKAKNILGKALLEIAAENPGKSGPSTFLAGNSPDTTLS